MMMMMMMMMMKCRVGGGGYSFWEVETITAYIPLDN